MKKLYTLLFILLSLSTTYSQGSEDFTNSAATATYADGSFVGNGGITWTYGHSRNQGTGTDDYSITGNGLMLRRASDSYLEAVIPGGVGEFTFQYRKAFTGASERQLELLVNGVAVTTSTAFGAASGAEATIYNFSHTVNQPGNVTIRIKNVGSTTTNKQTTIDNITWTAFSGTPTPSLIITSPVDMAYLSPETTSVNVAFNVINFNVANGTGDGHIHYTINGGGVVMKYDTTPINIPTAQGNVYVVYMELVDNAHNPIVPAVNATVTFEVTDYIIANTIAEVRAAGAGDYVHFTGEAVVTYSRTTRNQKYIQDATGAILIDDNTNIITTPFVIGDGISNVRGLLSDFSGTLQLLPNQDATKPSTGNTITPQVVTAANIAGDIEAYESELVQINNATFTTADGIITFATSQNYNLNDGSDILFRTSFAEADYIGTLVPSGAANRIVLVGEFNGTAQVVSRSLAEVTLSSSSFNAIDGLTMYPNPLKGNTLYLTSTANADMSVQIFDVLGKEVVKSNVMNNTVNISGLNAGIYIVKVTEEGKTATRKLVIQ